MEHPAEERVRNELGTSCWRRLDPQMWRFIHFLTCMSVMWSSINWQPIYAISRRHSSGRVVLAAAQLQLAPLQAATTAPIKDPFQKLPSRHADGLWGVGYAGCHQSIRDAASRLAANPTAPSDSGRALLRDAANLFGMPPIHEGRPQCIRGDVANSFGMPPFHAGCRRSVWDAASPLAANPTASSNSGCVLLRDAANLFGMPPIHEGRPQCIRGDVANSFGMPPVHAGCRQLMRDAAISCGMPPIHSAGCRQPAGSSTPWPQVQLPLLPSSSNLDDSNLDEGPTLGGNQNNWPRQQTPQRLPRAAGTVQPVAIAPIFDPSRAFILGFSRNCLPTGLGDAWREMAKVPVVSLVDLLTLLARLLHPVLAAF
ncbi:hypothetical protein Purlil1_12176 [Purpureocillium lilacinum]|uniref:Uncharacterized protein n=1 Tax=Purpureocillium lilacinum TaxID=33203 RepID=A0ABR0BI57_PURLI|nr:hypothetical protein Purlil1_12176 [Purpureocillium lilacinum]